MDTSDKAPKTYTVEYRFELEDGTSLSHTIEIDRTSILSTYDTSQPRPDWARMDSGHCDGCELTGSEYCPVAVRLAPPIKLLDSLMSFHHVHAVVTTEDRTYSKHVDAQEAIRSMFGLIMATSDCPSMSPFKLMARFHLPFTSSLDEMTFRVVSAYLLRQLLKFSQKGDGSIPIDLGSLDQLYARMNNVNKGVAARIRSAVKTDGAVNAMVIFDSMSQLIPIILEEELDKLRPLVV